MLYVKNGLFESKSPEYGWHAGERFPLVPEARKLVMSFQADGDELLLILSVLDKKK